LQVARLSEVRGYGTTLYFVGNMKRNVNKLLQALGKAVLLGFAGGLGKALWALIIYLLTTR
jgi:hypothetical protein